MSTPSPVQFYLLVREPTNYCSDLLLLQTRNGRIAGADGNKSAFTSLETGKTNSMDIINSGLETEQPIRVHFSL